MPQEAFGYGSRPAVRLLPRRPQRRQPLRFGRRAVGLLALVVGQVEQLVGPARPPVVLPVAAPQRPLAAHPPEQVALLRHLVPQQIAREADAVQRVGRVRPRPAELQQGRRPVGREHREVADLVGVDPGGPAQHRGHADAALLERALVAGQRPVVGEPLAAVVAGEEDQGVLLLARPLQRLQDLADRAVQVLDHLRVLLDRAAVGVPQGAAVTGLDPADDLGGGLRVAVGDPRPVRGGEVQVEQPWLVVVPLDVLARALGQDPGVVAQVLVLGVALVQVVLMRPDRAWSSTPGPRRSCRRTRPSPTWWGCGPAGIRSATCR